MKSSSRTLVALALLCSALTLLAACGTTPGGDKTPPSLITATPVNGSVEVQLNATLFFRFDEPIASLELTPTPLVGLSAALWDEAGEMATIAPSPAWPSATSLSFTVTATDEAGNELTFTHGFTTVDDETPPAAPTGLVALASEEAVSVSWDANTESDLSGYLLFWGQDVSSPSGVVALSAAVTEYGVSGLENGVTYEFYLIAEDSAGNRSSPSATVTATPGDVTPPTLTSSTPSDGSTGVGLVELVRFAFSEPLVPASLSVALYEVQPPAEGQPIDPTSPVVRTLDISLLGAALWNGTNTVVQFSDVAPDLFESDKAYRFALQATDLAGNALPAQTSVSFLTGDVEDVIAPTVASFQGLVDHNLGRAALGFVFSEAMDKAATQAAFNSAPGLTCVWSWPTAASAICTVNSGLLQVQSYAVQLTTGARDLAGNALGSIWNGSFYVGNLSPRLVSYTPAERFGMPATVHNQFQPITWTFSEPVRLQGIVGEVRHVGTGALVDTITVEDNLIVSPDDKTITYYPPVAYSCVGDLYTWSLTRVYELEGGAAPRATPITYSGSFRCGDIGVGGSPAPGSYGE